MRRVPILRAQATSRSPSWKRLHPCDAQPAVGSAAAKALVPRPGLHLVRFHLVLVPSAKLRALVVPAGEQGEGAARQDSEPYEPQNPHRRTSRIGWARPFKRVFEINMEHRPNCGGGLKIITATLETQLLERTLSHHGLPARGCSGTNQSEGPLAFTPDRYFSRNHAALGHSSKCRRTGANRTASPRLPTAAPGQLLPATSLARAAAVQTHCGHSIPSGRGLRASLD